MKVHGSCRCKGIRYEAAVDPGRVAICLDDPVRYGLRTGCLAERGQLVPRKQARIEELRRRTSLPSPRRAS